MVDVPTQQPSVTACPLDDELVLYEPTRGQPYVLNATAAQIWAWCNGTRSVATIARLLADSHGLTLEQASSDAQACLADLRETGLLRP